jgi:hypothetical protein
MASVDELEKRVAKLEKPGPRRVFFEFLLAPAILLGIGFWFNWTLQEAKGEIERIEIAHEIVAEALAGDYDQSFVTLKLVRVILDEELAEEIVAAVTDYLSTKAEASLAEGRPEETVAIVRAATRSGGDAGERVKQNVLESKLVEGAPDLLAKAEQADLFASDGFRLLAEGNYRDAAAAFQRADQAYPDYGTAAEIHGLLTRNLAQMDNPEVEQRVLGSIADRYTEEAPVKQVQELQGRLRR